MIFVDSNLFVVDLRYPNDRNARVNRRALARLEREKTGVTSLLNLLEVCGILSFNLSPAALHALYAHFERRYGVAVIPAGGEAATIPTFTAADVLRRMEQRMALKDAGIALVVERYAATVTTFLSWNARHFSGKLPVPALTPREWLGGGSSRR